MGGFFALGILLLRVARWELVARWHLMSAAIHLLLGRCNLLFWSLVVSMGVVTVGSVVTTCRFFGTRGLLWAAWR